MTQSKSDGINREDARLLPRLSTASAMAPVTGAGFKLDALIDERVFGHSIGWRNSFSWRTDIIDEIKGNSRGYDLISESRIAGAWIPHYSTSIADAWLVVERLCDDGWTFELTNSEQPAAGFWLLGGIRGRWALRYSNADTAPLALCLAALKAVGA